MTGPSLSPNFTPPPPMNIQAEAFRSRVKFDTCQHSCRVQYLVRAELYICALCMWVTTCSTRHGEAGISVYKGRPPDSHERSGPWRRGNCCQGQGHPCKSRTMALFDLYHCRVCTHRCELYTVFNILRTARAPFSGGTNLEDRMADINADGSQHVLW